MKNILKALVAMFGIIVARIILSSAYTDQVGEVFSKVSIGILFYYFICKFIKSRSIAAD
ncbi:MAG: hypothetical protein HDR13_12130 [Lachnospiraceae bacterium]|nr:hypothetical protein [Lachnospiraceae bacterium]